MRGVLLLLTFFAVCSVPEARNVHGNDYGNAEDVPDKENEENLPSDINENIDNEQTFPLSTILPHADEIEDETTDVTDGYNSFTQPDTNNSSVASLPNPQEEEFVGVQDNKPRRTQPRKEPGSCGPPPFFERATIASGINSTYGPGSVVTYSCQFGYVSDGLRQVKCTQSEESGELEWSQSEVRCTPRSCGDPGSVDNGKRIGSLFTFPNRVSFECEDGYELKGNSARYCQPSGTWSGKLPKCQKFSCKPPPDIDNGQVSYSSLEFGSELRYTCNAGFLLRNHYTRYCAGNRTWSGEDPVCKDAQCDLPVAPKYGSFKLTDDKPVVDTRVIFECDRNKLLTGNRVSICMENGDWTFPPPTCIDPCSVPRVSHGKIWKYSYYRDSEVPVGSIIDIRETLYLRCERNYEPLGRPEKEVVVKCTNGVWENFPKCEPGSCHDDYPRILNGFETSINRTNGGHVWYKCLKYFKKTKTGNITCSSGTWIGITPVCSDTRCYFSKLPSRGLKYQKETFDHGQSFNPVCEEKYTLTKSNNRLTCLTGDWIGHLPPCMPASCKSQPPRIDHGRFKSYSEDHSSVVEYECEEGFALDYYQSSKVECLFGEWKGTPPKCRNTETPNTSKPKQEQHSTRVARVTSRPNVASPTSIGGPEEDCSCTYFKYYNNLVGLVDNKRLESGTRVKKNCRIKFYCRKFGFQILIGTPELVCDRCKGWHSSEYPQCVDPTPDDVLLWFSLEVNITDENEISLQEGQSLEVYCYSYTYETWWKYPPVPVPDINFRRDLLELRDKRFRQAAVLEILASVHNSGVYSCYADRNKPRYIQIKVKAIECPLIEETEGLSVNYENGQKANSRVFFLCKEERASLVGYQDLTCQSNGRWSGEPPRCNQPVQCPEFEKKEGITIAYINDRYVGSTAAFHCFKPRERTGESHATCREDGTWSHPEPLCSLPSCSLEALFKSFPEDVTTDNEQRKSDAMPYNSTVTLRCKDENLVLLGRSEATCKENGSWIVPNLNCVSGCPLPQSPDLYLIIEPSKHSYDIGDRIALSCPTGMALSSDVVRLMCLHDGWSETQLPSCLLLEDKTTFPKSETSTE